MIKTPLTRWFDLTTPVIGAPMAGVAGGELARAVSLGGGLGMIISRGFGLGIASGGDRIIAGGVLVIVLCLGLDGLLALLERAVTPAHLRRAKAQTRSVNDSALPVGEAAS